MVGAVGIPALQGGEDVKLRSSDIIDKMSGFFAYGPIKGDPELMEIRAELEKVQGVMAGLAAKLAAAEKRISGV